MNDSCLVAQLMMKGYLSKVTGLSQYFNATTLAVAAAKSTINPAVVLGRPAAVVPALIPIGGTNQHKGVPGHVLATSGVRSAGFVRWAHTDIRVPDFTEYRRDSVKDPEQRSSDSAPERLSFTYIITAGG